MNRLSSLTLAALLLAPLAGAAATKTPDDSKPGKADNMPAITNKATFRVKEIVEEPR